MRITLVYQLSISYKFIVTQGSAVCKNAKILALHLKLRLCVFVHLYQNLET